MAREQKKDKKELTPEERLQQALVPEEEWPYQLPEGWKWVYLGGIADEVTDKTDTFNDQTVKYIGLENITSNNGINGWQSTVGIKSTKTVFNTGDILYGKLRPYLNKHDVTTFSGVCSTDILVLRSSELADARFINYYLNTDSFIDYAVFNSKGINLPRVSPSAVTKACIPLPNLIVQRKIISFLNQEFSHLDEAKDRIQSILDSSEKRKQSILYKAVTGNLSARWRKENGCSIKEWNRCSISDVCKGIKVGIVIKPTRYYTNSQGVPAFRSANVREFHVQDSDWVYISEQGQRENQRTIVHTNDVLIVRSGNPGTACVVPEKFDGCNAIDIIIAVPDQSKIDPEYLCVFTNSPVGRGKIQSGVRGMALTHFNVTSYGKLEIDVPSLSEQREIVRLVRRYLEKENAAMKTARAALDQLETIRNAILNKAFHGELIG